MAVKEPPAGSGEARANGLQREIELVLLRDLPLGMSRIQQTMAGAWSAEPEPWSLLGGGGGQAGVSRAWDGGGGVVVEGGGGWAGGTSAGQRGLLVVGRADPTPSSRCGCSFPPGGTVLQRGGVGLLRSEAPDTSPFSTQFRTNYWFCFRAFARERQRRKNVQITEKLHHY